MNDSVERELMTVVERAVRPVRASVYQKRRMREELLTFSLWLLAKSRHASDARWASLEVND